MPVQIVRLLYLFDCRKLWVSKKDLAESLKIKEKLMSEVLGFLKEKHFVKSFPEEQNKGKNKRKRDEYIYYSLEYEKVCTKGFF